MEVDGDGRCGLFICLACQVASLSPSLSNSHIPPTQAAARQQKFEQSAGGRAAMKAVKAVQEEKAAAAARPVGAGGATAQDWLS